MKHTEVQILGKVQIDEADKAVVKGHLMYEERKGTQKFGDVPNVINKASSRTEIESKVLSHSLPA